MKQLYLTYCREGEGLEMRPGEQLRAASSGLPDQRMRRLSGMMGYTIPALPSEDLKPETAPIRLAFLAEGETGGRVLAQARYVGEDPASGRLGNYFAHLLADIPDTVTARDAVRAWRSPAWVARDDGGPKELPDVGRLPGGPLDDGALLNAVQSAPKGPNYLDYIGWLANALLAYEGRRADAEQSGGGDENGQAERRPIVLVATPDDAALLLYGATRILPPAVLKHLTFSLYERIDDSLTSLATSRIRTWVTATCRPEITAYDVPDRFYANTAATLNVGTGRRSTLSGAPPLLASAIASLAAGDLATIDSFQTLCAELRLTSLAMVELAFAISHGKAPSSLTAQEMEIVAQAPALTHYLSTRDGFFARLVALATDERFRNGAFARILESLRPQADRLSGLAAQAISVGDGALIAGQVEQATVTFKVILPLIDSQIADVARQQLVSRLAGRLHPQFPRDALTLSARLATLSLSGWDDGAWDADRTREWLDRWVNLTQDETPHWLLPANAAMLRLSVARLALTQGVLPPGEIARRLANADMLLLNLYLGLARDGKDALARDLLVAFAPPPGSATSTATASAGASLVPTPDTNVSPATPSTRRPQSRLALALSWLIAAPEADRDVALQVAGPLLERIGERITADNFEQADYPALIEWVDRHRDLIPQAALSHAMRDRYWAWHSLYAFLAWPHLSVGVLERLPQSYPFLTYQPEATLLYLKQRITGAIAQYLATPVSEKPTQPSANGRNAPQTAPLATYLTLEQQLAALEQLLFAWGPTLGGSAMTWYCDMLADMASWSANKPTEPMLSTCLLLGLQGARMPQLASAFSPQDLALDIEDIVRVMDRRNVDLVSRAAKSWPEAPRGQWQRLASAHHFGQTGVLDRPLDLLRRFRSRALDSK